MEKSKGKRALRIKIISMGNAEVGKSCIIKRYCEKRFVHKYLATIGIDYGVSKVTIKDREVKVNIFDMAGHPIFYENVSNMVKVMISVNDVGDDLKLKAVRNEFYKDTQGAILVFDVCDRASFDSLEHWLLEMQNEMGNQAEHDNVVICVCANKCDRKRAVDEHEARLWADSKGFMYFETSAQTGEGVNEMFQALFEGVVTAAENGGKKAPFQTQLGYTKDQIEAIQRLKNAKGDYERLGLVNGASKDEVNKAYRRLAVLLHPDKNVAPGSEEAFKILVAARTALLKRCS